MLGWLNEGYEFFADTFLIGFNFTLSTLLLLIGITCYFYKMHKTGILFSITCIIHVITIFWIANAFELEALLPMFLAILIVQPLILLGLISVALVLYRRQKNKKSSEKRDK
jgi:NADH:ubiquinone oxidoreductase subunit K